MDAPKANKNPTGDGNANPALSTPTDLKPQETNDIATTLNILLADVFALYMKTKNFHWHMSAPLP